MKFCCFTAGSGVAPVADQAEFAFFLHATSELVSPKKKFNLSSEDIYLLNPNTITCPIFRSNLDAEINIYLYKKNETLYSENLNSSNSHKYKTTRIFDINKQREDFLTREELLEKGGVEVNEYIILKNIKFIRLYEGKVFSIYDHRNAVPGTREEVGIRTGNAYPVSDSQHKNADFFIPTVLYIEESKLDSWSNGKLTRKYIHASMDITSALNHRTFIGAILPDVATDYSVRIGIYENHNARHAACLLSLQNSFCYDYLIRQKLQGLHLSDYITYQVVVPAKTTLTKISSFIIARILELSYSSWDLKDFANECNYNGPPFRWDEDRRFLLLCELDATFFHLYLGTTEEWHEQGTAELLEAFPNPRDAAHYIMETFPIVKRKDEEKFGRFRTKETILEIYDEMAEAMQSGEAYQTRLDPPPGPPTRADGEFLPYESYAENPPPHIHPPRVGAADLSEYQLSDLKQDFPRRPFKLRTGVSADAPIHQIMPCLGKDLQDSNRALIVHPDLQLSDSKIGAAFGKITINHFRDASTQEPLVVVRIKTTEGRASLRIFPDQWDSLNTVGKIHNEENHHGQTHPKNSSE